MPNISTFLVRGSASRLPRGYLWVLPVWFTMLAAIPLIVAGRLSSPMPWWLAGGEAVAVLLSGLVVLGTLATVRRHALRIGPAGVSLGIASTRAHPGWRQVHVPWSHVAQVRLADRRYGVRLAIMLGPGSVSLDRLGPGRQALLLLGCLAMPFGVGRSRPAMTIARMRPPSYVVKVCDVTADQLRVAICQVKPAEVPVLTAVRPGRVRRPLGGPLRRARPAEAPIAP